MKIFSQLFCVILVMTSVKAFSQQKPFVSDDFKVPDSLVTQHFKLKPLSPKYCERDYKAFTSSFDHLKNVFGPQSDWPNPKMTLAESLISIEEDYKLFKSRKGFSYSVLSLDESEVLGCVYIFPAQGEYDAQAVMWVSQKSFDNGLDPILLSTVEKWLRDVWPFKNVAYPGRRIGWEEWVKR